jgi:ribosomal protein S18 acetylase RimI-like enzyme
VEHAVGAIVDIARSTDRRGVALRPARPADVPALDALAEAHVADLLPWLPPELAGLQARARERDLRQTYAGPRVLVVELAGHVVGRLLVAGSAADGRADLVDVVVDPRQRGTGLGTAALHAWLADVDGSGAEAHLAVAALSPARRWFERHGFVEDTDSPADPVRMTLRRRPASRP